ncbi:MAG: anaerobic glycerol-3-phosphate dehydrogenase subunit A [Candidatus Dormibacteraeota bacterium]|nr:anaerobic glycerol-3-phosphate dehydrogenase subunit A [Candidatus Dormibacteraeota bacterium]
MTQLETEVLVIGGGSTGAGVAWDSALRGLHVTLVDRGDLATGTTGRFHGLLHSGGRYVVKDPSSARECARENLILRRVASDCIEDTGGLFLTTPLDDPDYADRFLGGCREADIPVEEIPVQAALRQEPRLNPKISRAFTVPDASVDAWKTVWACVRGATALGARVLTYHSVVRLVVEGGAVRGAVLLDHQTGAEVTIHAQCTVNASGAWSGHVAQLAGCEVGVVPGKGIMVAMNHRIVNTVVNRCTMPGDGDIIVPIRTVCVIGTTDVPVTDPDAISATPAEVAEMMEAGEALVPGFGQSRALRVWAGARPLLPKSSPDGDVKDTREVTRSHSVLDHAERDGIGNFVTITGGKFTTFRLMAEDAVNLVGRKLGRELECRTATEPLPDSEAQHYYWIGARQQEMEADAADDPLICECELVSRRDLQVAVARRPEAQLDDLRRALRVGMGPCQGGFCAFRVAGLLHQDGHFRRSAANQSLRAFVEERWKGVKPISWGDQARQTRLDEWIFQGTLDLEHLPE